MSGRYSYPYPAHYVTTDIVVFTYRDGRLHLLLVERGGEPHRGMWALPGGFLKPDEELDACARRELSEETALTEFFLEPLTTVGTVGRDPRGRVITVAYLALVRWGREVRGGTDARDARWFPLDALPELAFDHDAIVAAAHDYLARMLTDKPMLFLRFLPDEFTIEQMQSVHAAVLTPVRARRSLKRRVAAPVRTEIRPMVLGRRKKS